MTTNPEITFHRNASGRYSVLRGTDVLGTVWNNGTRPNYSRHWSARTPDGTEVRTGTRSNAADALVAAWDAR